jgi:hypothetical protein
MARAQLVDVSLARWYHCVTRCVRRAFLLGEGDYNRKEWLENRLEELADIRHVARFFAGELRPTRRLHWPTLSPGQSFDLGGRRSNTIRVACPYSPVSDEPKRVVV